MTVPPPSDPIEAGLAIIAAASFRRTPLRLIGGIAVAAHCPDLDPSLRRSFGDIDFATEAHACEAVQQLFSTLGYTPRVDFNSLHGDQRLIFVDEHHARQIDVFVGDFVMCHTVPLGGRLTADPISIPLAELLLTKLQVVELNHKDMQDAAAIMAGHPLGEGDEETINVDRLRLLTGGDWGLYTTVGRSLEKVVALGHQLPSHLGNRVVDAADEMQRAMTDAPKSRSWRLRSRIGTRLRWYELPEEP